MDFLAELLIGIQIVLAVASIPLALLSKRTSRTAHARHETFLAIAVFIAILASLGALMAVYGAGTTDRTNYLLALLPPIATTALCALVIWRGSQAIAISRRRRRI